MNTSEGNHKVESTQDHCAYCFDVLIGILNKEFSLTKFPPIPEFIPKFEAPLFVTWHKNDDLRGCIGIYNVFFLLYKVRNFFKRTY